MRRLVVSCAVLGWLFAASTAGLAGHHEHEPPPRPHPYPSGDEWPDGLTGPFDLLEVTRARVPSHDGTVLDGWIYRPALPEGVNAPVVLWSAPYFGQTMPAGDSPFVRDNTNAGEAVPVDLLVRQGYAVALFNVRGTGLSGGCFEMMGQAEQADQAFLVEWLADRPWSNGRVGMMGLSYHGTTPWMAAIQNPPSLKTIVVAGMISDLYTFYHSPQGAVFTIGAPFQTAFNATVSFVPPPVSPPGRTVEDFPGVAADRMCPEVARTMTSLAAGTATDERDAPFWEERRLIDEFPGVTTSVLLTHGFLDLFGSGHQQQEDDAWHALRLAPKRMLVGQWAHEFPNFNTPKRVAPMADWNQRLTAWLDYWLKGVGDSAPRLGAVDYQDSTGAWQESSSWPPAESRAEVLYARGRALDPASGLGTRSFVAAPTPHFCAAGSIPDEGGHWVMYQTEPVTDRTVVAGNPFALLNLESSLPGGLVTMFLFDLWPGFRCDGALFPGAPSRMITYGAADLRFHDGRMHGADFPVGTPTHVRVDLANLAEVIEPGHSLGLLVWNPTGNDRTSQPHTPRVTLHAGVEPGATHLVVPVRSGGFGGLPPATSYPPKPFVP